MLSASSASGCFPSLSSLGMCKCLCMRVCVCKCPLCLRIWMENPHIWQQSPLRFCTTRLLRFHSRVEGVFSSLLGLSLIFSILHLAALSSPCSLILGTHTHTLLQSATPSLPKCPLSLFYSLSATHLFPTCHLSCNGTAAQSTKEMSSHAYPYPAKRRKRKTSGMAALATENKRDGSNMEKWGMHWREWTQNGCWEFIFYPHALLFIVKNTNHVPLACLDSIPCHFGLKALSFLTLTLADRDLWMYN